jgi:hypothetical protein
MRLVPTALSFKQGRMAALRRMISPSVSSLFPLPRRNMFSFRKREPPSLFLNMVLAIPLCGVWYYFRMHIMEDWIVEQRQKKEEQDAAVAKNATLPEAAAVLKGSDAVAVVAAAAASAAADAAATEAESASAAPTKRRGRLSGY